ncbi:MAG: rhomboid family intramembrane serine protease [Pirellulaceae bacterium]
MRCLGEIDGRKRAESFVAFLLTENISTQIECVDEASDRWELWIREEDQLPQAREELRAFEDNPHDARYAGAMHKAAEILAKKERERQLAAKNIRRVSTTRSSVRSGRIPPLTLTLLILCVVVGLFNSFGNPKPTNELGVAISEQLSFVTRSSFDASGGDPLADIKRGQIWRIITPIFLHGDIIHLAMNMFVLVSFGRMVEGWLGTPRYALFVLVLAIGPNLLQGLSPAWMQGSPFFVGISGVLYGFFGYVWVRSSMNPSLGISIPMPMVLIFVGLIVLGMSGAFPDWHLAHLCHLGGLLMGAVLAVASEAK